MKFTNKKPGGGLANLCFTNSWLQGLSGISEFKEFFKSRKYQEDPSIHYRQDLPVSTEISKLFNMRNTIIASASTLRSLVALASGKIYLANGEQQCLDEFHQAVFDCLRAEFKKINCRTGEELLDKFIITSVREKRFQQQCKKCGDLELNQEVDFYNVLHLDGLENCEDTAISHLLTAKANSKHFASQRCSCKCICEGGSISCLCKGVCTKTNNDCKCNRVTITSERILSHPQYIIILLQRHERTPKYENIIQPDHPLIFGGNNFQLQSIVNHIGNSRKSGHYTALLQGGPTGWYNCNDEEVSPVNYHPSKHNYMFVYSRQSGELSALLPPVSQRRQNPPHPSTLPHPPTAWLTEEKTTQLTPQLQQTTPNAVIDQTTKSLELPQNQQKDHLLKKESLNSKKKRPFLENSSSDSDESFIKVKCKKVKNQGKKKKSAETTLNKENCKGVLFKEFFEC